MKQSAVEWLVKYINGYNNKFSSAFEKEINIAKKIEQEQIGYNKEEVFKMINDFCFDWNYNYKGELSQKQYLIEWFERIKK
jgi:hypothetical protein